MTKIARQHRIPWRDESGFFLSGILVRFIILLALFGLTAYDTTQVVLAQVRAQSVSRVAATAGADTYYRTKRADLAERDAVLAARELDPTARIYSFFVDSSGRVTVGAEKTANTVLLKRLGGLKKYNLQKADDLETRLQ
jgi:hypothetical protein